MFVAFFQLPHQALAEASDLEALRAEKRAIAAEEKRLKALLEMERAKAARKADRQAAMRAEKQRQAAKGEYRREKVRRRPENAPGSWEQLIVVVTCECSSRSLNGREMKKRR